MSVPALWSSAPHLSVVCGVGAVRFLDEFQAVVQRVVRTIVDERAVPEPQRTIRPIDIGGVAGGMKYMVDGVFFKFALDQGGLYGSDALAMKSASHEFRSLMDIACHAIPVFFPLLMMTDYRGYHITAVAQLPVGSNTLVYGSADGALRSLRQLRQCLMSGCRRTHCPCGCERNQRCHGFLRQEVCASKNCCSIISHV